MELTSKKNRTHKIPPTFAIDDNHATSHSRIYRDFTSVNASLRTSSQQQRHQMNATFDTSECGVVDWRA